MPLYTIKHTTPLLPKQKDDLADAITSIHAGMFGAPRVFVNVHFDHANVEEEARVMYVGGKRREHNNQLIACVRTGPSRTREDYDHLTSRIQSAWDSIVNTPSHPSTRLRAIFVMGSILAGREIGFALPQAGEDRAWLEENAAEFSRLAGEGDEEMKELVKDMREANGFGCKGN